MKIIFYINSLGFGGAERVVANLANQFAAQGDQVGVVTSFPLETEYELDTGVVRYNLETANQSGGLVKRNLRRTKALRKILKAEMPDVLVSFMAEANYRALLAAKGLSTKTIISVRNDPCREYAGKLGRFLAKHLLPSANGCVFQTEDAKAWFPEKLQRKSEIIFNAVREDFYGVKRSPISGRVITLGRLNVQKNHKMLIEAFEKTYGEFPNATLWIYGEGGLREEIEALIADKQLQGVVVLKGATSDVAGALSEASVFVLSSDYEGMPNALMEALTVGVPCISTDCPCGGPKTLIVNGENGLLVPINDAEAMANALKKLLFNAEYAEQLGERAKEKAMEYHPEKVFAYWRGYVEKICQGD